MKFWITSDSLRTGEILCIEGDFSYGGKFWVTDVNGRHYARGQWADNPQAAMRRVRRQRAAEMKRLRKEIDRLDALEFKII